MKSVLIANNVSSCIIEKNEVLAFTRKTRSVFPNGRYLAGDGDVALSTS